MSENNPTTESPANDSTGYQLVRPPAMLNVNPTPPLDVSPCCGIVERIVVGVVLFGLWAMMAGWTYVVLQFEVIYRELGADLPLLTRLAVGYSETFGGFMGLATTFCLAGGLTVAYARMSRRSLRRRLLAAIVVLALLLLAVGVEALYMPLKNVSGVWR